MSVCLSVEVTIYFLFKSYAAYQFRNHCSLMIHTSLTFVKKIIKNYNFFLFLYKGINLETKIQQFCIIEFLSTKSQLLYNSCFVTKKVLTSKHFPSGPLPAQYGLK